MKYLITGGCGFIGSNLAAEVLKRGEELVVFDNLFRFGSSSNLEWLKEKGNFKYYPFDIRNLNDIETVIKKEQPDTQFDLNERIYSIDSDKTNDIIIRFDAEKLTPQNFQIIVNLSEMLKDSGEVGEMEYDIFKFYIKSLQTYEKDLIVCKS